MLSQPLAESLLACRILVQNKINELLPANFTESRLLDAMRYSTLSEGKRIRPFLLMLCAELFGTQTLEALNAAAALEFVHTYSLIHDDLPAMDNDDYRRGKLTCHKEYDEATAILAGDALLTYAFEILADPKTHKDANVRCELVRILAKSAGFRGMVGGQMIDLENSDSKITKEQMANLHRLKTGELFMASCEMGAVLGHATIQERQYLRFYANDLGLAFQIKDDLLDHSGNILDKVENAETTSIVAIIGVENAEKQLLLLKEQAISHLKTFGDKARILKDLAEFVATRSR